MSLDHLEALFGRVASIFLAPLVTRAIDRTKVSFSYTKAYLLFCLLLLLYFIVQGRHLSVFACSMTEDNPGGRAK
jgi:hypothetical protein